MAIGYADLVVALGHDPVGCDLVEHLRPHDTLLLPGLDAPLLPEMLAVTHDPDVALARVHPATTQAWSCCAVRRSSHRAVGMPTLRRKNATCSGKGWPKAAWAEGSGMVYQALG